MTVSDGLPEFLGLDWLGSLLGYLDPATKHLLGMAAQASPVTVKGAALSLQAVYNVAHGSPVELDSVFLDALAKPGPKGAPALLPRSSLLTDEETEQAALTNAEAKSVLFVLLHKLLQGAVQGSFRLRPVVPLLLVEVLNSSSAFACTGILSTVRLLYDLNEANLDVDVGGLKKVLVEKGAKDFGLTKDEWEAIQGCNAVNLGKTALALYSLSPVPNIADLVAALSCEALRADVRSFEQGFPEAAGLHRASADVASALKTLLGGSKLVNPRKGAISGNIISSIPAVHALFRGALKSCTDTVAGEVNWPAGSPSLSGLLVEESVTSLLRSLERVASISSGRLALSAGILGESSPQKDSGKALGEHLEAATISPSATCSNSIRTTDVDVVLKSLALEAGVALAILTSLLPEGDNKSLVNNSSEPNGSLIQNGGKPISEKKKKGTLELGPGKGTSLFRQVVTRILQDRLQPAAGEDWFALEWCNCLLKFFQPEDKQLPDLFVDVKSILESNEARRLPKIPKVTCYHLV